MVDVLVPLVVEEIVAVVQEKDKLLPQDREKTDVEHAPVPQILGETVEVVARRNEFNDALSMCQCLKC